MTFVGDLADEAAMPNSGIVVRPRRERLERYLAERLAVIPGAGDRDARILNALLDAAFSGPNGAQRRHPAIIDGSPAMFSHKQGARSDASLRIQVDSALPSVPLQEHVDRAVVTVNRICDLLDWSGVAAEAGAWVRAAFSGRPEDPSGGIRLGYAVDERAAELRIYVNPAGSTSEGWERSIALMRWFGNACAKDAFEDFAARFPRATPVLVTLILRARAVRGVRLYVRPGDPSAAAVRQLGVADDRIVAIANAFSDRRGGHRSKRYGAPCVAYDFPIAPDRGIDLRPQRVKVDFLLCALPEYLRANSPSARSWLERLYALAGLKASEAFAFLDGLDRAFGGYRIEVFSVGCCERGVEAALYATPGGLRALYW